MALWIKKIKRKDGSVRNRYYGTVYVPTGERYSNGKPKYRQETASLGNDVGEISRNEALALYLEFHKQVLSEVESEEGIEGLTLYSYSKQYIDYAKNVARKRSWDRDELCLKNLKNYLGDLPLVEITPAKLISYQQKRLKDGMSPQTVNIELSCLRRVLNVAYLQGKYELANPVKRVPFLKTDNKKYRILTQEEQAMLLNSSAPSLKPVLICALATGMRRGEITSLKWSSVDLKNKIITVESERAKSKRSRDIPINEFLLKLLKDIQKTNKTEYVFLNNNGDPFSSPTGVRTSFQNAIKKSKIGKLRFHDLRHTAGTRMSEAGVPLYDVGKILGHSTPLMTQRYAHPTESLKAAVKALEKYFHDN